MEDQEKNAALYEAAPDLLAACVAALKELRVVEDGSTGGVPNSIIALIPEAIDQLSAAIAKATQP